MRRWYVVACQPRQEARADENLRRQGFDSWLPVFRRTRRHARRVDSVQAPLFPGYLFVSLDPEEKRWRSINGTRGVARIVCNGDEPLAVPDGIVDEILARRDESGVITLPPARFVVGQPLRVAGGAFAELEGLFQEMAGGDRVVLLFDLLGRQVRAKVPLTGLAA